MLAENAQSPEQKKTTEQVNPRDSSKENKHHTYVISIMLKLVYPQPWKRENQVIEEVMDSIVSDSKLACYNVISITNPTNLNILF